jgi:hypothetical protein
MIAERGDVMPTDDWHLDKRVPITLILALLIQTAGMVWWAATLSTRVENHGRDISVLQSEATILRTSAQTQAVQLGRIEEQITGLRSDMGRLIAAFERSGR